MTPRLMHGCDWDGRDVAGWWASEKLNGWRALWTGERLITRQGEELASPGWFTADLPRRSLDAELWAGPGTTHDQVNGHIRAGRWSSLTLRPFDIPELGFKTEAAQDLLQRIPMGLYARPVEYFRIGSTREAIAMMRRIVAGGGEGLMLRKPMAGYAPDYRTEKLLKLKPAMVS